MNRFDQARNSYMLCGPLARRGYLRWWHSFVGVSTVTGLKHTFFFEYLILNPILEAKKKGRLGRPSYIRISAGFFPDDTSDGMQLHAYYPIHAAKYASKPLFFQVEDNTLSEQQINGYLDIAPSEAEQDLLATDAGTMEWHLDIRKTIACHTGFIASPLFCALNAMDSFWHGEGIRAQYSGFVECNGEKYAVTPEDSFGYADKHWGRSYNSPWLLLASCRLYSERTGKLLKHSALAVSSCRPRFLCFRFRPRLLLQLTYTGEDYCYSFARPLSRTKIRWGCRTKKGIVSWKIKARNQTSALQLVIHSDKADLMPLQYDGPGREIGSKSSQPPVRMGGNGYGTLELYRITPSGKTWIDTLTIQNALCEYQRPTAKRRTSR